MKFRRNIMPYKSKAQERWAHTKEGKKALGGEAAVEEWDKATKGKKLPERKSKKRVQKNYKGVA